MIDDNIKNEKVQYNINREVEQITALPSGQIDRYPRCEEILPSKQSEMLEQAKFTCSLLQKAIQKQTKMIEDQGKK